MQFDPEFERKLTELQEWTNQSQEIVLEKAIDLYYQQLASKRKTPLEIMQENGFIGCIQAEPSLAADSEAILHEVFQQKV